MQSRRMFVAGAIFCASGIFQTYLFSQTKMQSSPRPVLVELFTSEGCSSCPPADAILRKIDGRRLDTGQLIVGISEHVTYWDRLGWKDPFSQAVFTDRQNAASAVSIKIDSAAPVGNALSVTFSVAGEVPRRGVDVFAVIADDQDTSNVLRGENKGRTITHVSVARSFVRVASLKAAESKTVTVPLPAAENTAKKRHLVLFAQQPGPGRVMAVVAEALSK